MTAYCRHYLCRHYYFMHMIYLPNIIAVSMHWRRVRGSYLWTRWVCWCVCFQVVQVLACPTSCCYVRHLVLSQPWLRWVQSWLTLSFHLLLVHRCVIVRVGVGVGVMWKWELWHYNLNSKPKELFVLVFGRWRRDWRFADGDVSATGRNMYVAMASRPDV